MDLQSKAGVVLLLGPFAYSHVKHGAKRLLSRLKRRSRSGAEYVAGMELARKFELFEALVTDLHEQGIDRVYHNSLRRVCDAHSKQMPGDLVETSHGAGVVLDLAGNMLGPFQTEDIVNLVRTCVLNPHLVVPGTDSDFVDLRIRPVNGQTEPWTVSNGVVTLCAAPSAAVAVYLRDRIADALAQIHLGYDAEKADRRTAARDYLNNPGQLRLRGMVATQDGGCGYVWTGEDWGELPLGREWPALFRAACVDPTELLGGVNFSRTSRGSVQAEWDGRVLARLDDGPDAYGLLSEMTAQVSSLVAQVRHNGGVEADTPVAAPLPRPAAPIEAPTPAEPGTLDGFLRLAGPHALSGDREWPLQRVAEHLGGLEGRVAALEAAEKARIGAPLAETNAQPGEQQRRRAIRA